MNKVTSRYYELQKKRIITRDIWNDTVRSNLSTIERGVEEKGRWIWRDGDGRP